MKTTIPCALCGYHAPEPLCPHCGGTSATKSLARPLSGPLRGVLDGLLAVPMGLWLLTVTRGTKRWLVPPFLVTFTLLMAALWWVFSWIDRVLDSVLPEDLSIGDAQWGWLEGLSERWDWLKSTWHALAVALDWSLNAVWGLLTSQPPKLLVYFLIGSLVAWYAFSIVYEALAGPFLDEVQGRLEKRWFGSDPRNRLQRPTDIPEERCARLSIGAGIVSFLALVAALFAPGLPLLLGLLLIPLPFVAVSLWDREYGRWLRWMATIEGRATWVSLQAAVITGILLVFALPLYFVPIVGYVLFACLTGFATAVGLLDIPFERRGIGLRQRLGFLFRNLLPLIAFGIVSGLLLSIPILGAALMVPAASIGGLWLICRLDKGSLRESSLRRLELRRARAARLPAGPPAP